mgnify:CR=1 FL=1
MPLAGAHDDELAAGPVERLVLSFPSTVLVTLPIARWTTATFVDYLVPSAADLPHFDTGNTVHVAPGNPIGAKGVGEAGTAGAPAATTCNRCGSRASSTACRTFTS